MWLSIVFVLLLSGRLHKWVCTYATRDVGRFRCLDKTTDNHITKTFSFKKLLRQKIHHPHEARTHILLANFQLKNWNLQPRKKKMWVLRRVWLLSLWITERPIVWNHSNTFVNLQALNQSQEDKHLRLVFDDYTSKAVKLV